jgi:hypothetical protein
MTVSILGVPYNVELVDRWRDVNHDDGDGSTLYGQIDYKGRSIRIMRDCDEQLLRTLIHEVLHGIIASLKIRELIDDDGNHLEAPIEQLSVGLATALESLGVPRLIATMEQPES